MDSKQERRGVGLVCLAVTAIGWGLNWTALKFLLREWSPLTARGLAGLTAALALALLAALRGQSLRVPRPMWTRLALAAAFNVAAWMGLSSVALLWLSAGEGATTAYTMPIWASLLAWPVLGERPTIRRLLALALGLCGIAVLFGGNGVAPGLAKLPGFAAALGAALLFATGTVLTKRAPLQLPPLAAVSWQVGLGCGGLYLAGLAIEPARAAPLSGAGWAAMAYMAAFPLAICYLTWFAALRRLPASVAALGTLLAPALGVVTGALVLGEQAGLREMAGLGLTLAGVLLAIRS